MPFYLYQTRGFMYMYKINTQCILNHLAIANAVYCLIWQFNLCTPHSCPCVHHVLKLHELEKGYTIILLVMPIVP